jgi:Ca2+-binding RTX toxin-like protein
MLKAGREVDPTRFGVVSGRKRFVPWLVAISALVALLALPTGTALAKRIAGTNGADRIVGTKKADRINARGGSDRVNGRDGGDLIKGSKGSDRLVGGKGADRLKGSKGKDRINGAKGKDRISAGKGSDRLIAVDGRRDRVVNGGGGKDVCTIDQVDLPGLRNCERAKVKSRGPGGGGGGGSDHELRVKDASGLTCGSALPLCAFQIAGDRADALVGLVSGHDGVTLAAGAGVSIVGDTWSAVGLYGCSSDGYLEVTIGGKSVRVPITCTG